jgi:hypothetical protein
MVAVCPDAMVESIAIVGPRDEVRRKVDQRLAFADAFTPVAPHYAVSPDAMAAYARAIAELFYPG